MVDRPPTPSAEAQGTCSFCGRGYDSARIVITGQGDAAICDECVDQCLDVLVERGGYLAAFPRLRGIWWKLMLRFAPVIKDARAKGK